MNEKAKGITDGFGHSHVNELANRIRRYLVFLGEYLFLERPRGLDFTMRDIGLYQKSAGKYMDIVKRTRNTCGRFFRHWIFRGAENFWMLAAAKAWS